MPQDTPGKRDAEFMQVMLSRPQSMGQAPYTKEIPWQDEDALTRFTGGVTGLDGPGGGVAGLLGAMVGMANPLDDIARYIKGAKGVGRMAEFAAVDDPRSISRHRLPQVEEAFQSSGKYTPEVSSEMGRLIGEMIDDKQVKAGWQEFRKRNPEATGHVRQLHLGPESMAAGGKLRQLRSTDQGGHFSEFPTSIDEREWAGSIYVNPNTLRHRLRPNTKADTVAHELQHHAQQMIEGKKQFKTNYNTLDRMMGYDKNPYEVEARDVAGDVARTVKLNKLSGR